MPPNAIALASARKQIDGLVVVASGRQVAGAGPAVGGDGDRLGGVGIEKALETGGRGVGHRLQPQPAEPAAKSLAGFLARNVAPPAAVTTDGWQGDAGLDQAGYAQEPINLSHSWGDAALRLPGIHLVFGLAKRWLLGTHHGAVSPKHLQAYLDEDVFRLYGASGCQALNVGIVFLPVSSSSRWRQPSRGLVHDVPRGARPLARIIAPQACIRRTRGDPDHDAAMRIGGEAPGRRAHSSTRHESHRKARVTATSDRHRQPAGEPWAGRETVSGAPLRPSPLTPPDAGRHRPASRRWSPNATAR